MYNSLTNKRISEMRQMLLFVEDDPNRSSNHLHCRAAVYLANAFALSFLLNGKCLPSGNEPNFHGYNLTGHQRLVAAGPLQYKSGASLRRATGWSDIK